MCGRAWRQAWCSILRKALTSGETTPSRRKKNTTVCNTNPNQPFLCAFSCVHEYQSVWFCDRNTVWANLGGNEVRHFLFSFGKIFRNIQFCASVSNVNGESLWLCPIQRRLTPLNDQPLPPPLPPGWHHLVMQYDGTQREIWRNGLCVARDVPGRPVVPECMRSLTS